MTPALAEALDRLGQSVTFGRVPLSDEEPEFDDFDEETEDSEWDPESDLDFDDGDSILDDGLDYGNVED